MAQTHGNTFIGGMGDRSKSASLGFNYLEAELLASRSRFAHKLRAGKYGRSKRPSYSEVGATGTPLR